MITTRRGRWGAACAVAILIGSSGQAIAARDATPGAPQVALSKGALSVGNRAVEAVWQTHGGRLCLKEFRDCASGQTYAWAAPAFVLELENGPTLDSRQLASSGPPVVRTLPADAQASRLSERLPGKAVEIRYAISSAKLDLVWRVTLREDSRYIRTELAITPSDAGTILRKLTLFSAPLTGARVCGVVRGSPLATETLYAAVEHPAAVSTVSGREGQAPLAECSYSRGVPLPVGQPFCVWAVLGVARPGQLRRDFNAYLNRERAHPYRGFLHYNSWYHLNIGRPENRMTEAEALQAIEDVGRELTTKRGVKLDSFVMDDGWDSNTRVWEFHDGFPQGFTNLGRVAARFGAGVGVWMSPWGGYGKPKETRLTHGRLAGLETNPNGFSMSGKNYGQHFLNVTLRMIGAYQANFFKFDGMGGGNFTDGADSAYANDIDALLHKVIGGMRRANPAVYISATTGTWASPFWLWHADSIWRQGDDTALAGVGSGREKWITYRDGTVYDRVCRRGPLYPINALMFHGVTIGDRAHPAKMERDERTVQHEVRTFFGSGTNLQELYISPHLLTSAMWDSIAESARWSRAHADCLLDSHWVGGNPLKLEVYGFAAWTPRQATLTLRNPADKPQNFALDAVTAFELPAGACQSYALQSPYRDQAVQSLTAQAGTPVKITLQPFEVLVFDARPCP